MGVVIVVQSDTNLLQIVLALCSASCLTSLLNSRQQLCDQDRDDRDHNQQLDQGEPRPANGPLSRFSRRKIHELPLVKKTCREQVHTGKHELSNALTVQIEPKKRNIF